MRRRLFTLLCVLSLALSLIAAYCLSALDDLGGGRYLAYQSPHPPHPRWIYSDTTFCSLIATACVCSVLSVIWVAMAILAAMRVLYRHRQRAWAALGAILVATSTLLFLAICGLAIRSYRTSDFWVHTSDRGPTLSWGLAGSQQQRIGVLLASIKFNDDTAGWALKSIYASDMERQTIKFHYAIPRSQTPVPASDTFFRRLGFRWERQHTVSGFGADRAGQVFAIDGIDVMAPDWMPAIIFAILPVRWLIIRVRRHRQRGPGLCAVCGYDLRASPQRCPECGTEKVSS